MKDLDEEVGKVGGSRKKLLAGIVVAVIVVACIGAVALLKNDSGGESALDFPVIDIRAEPGHNPIVINVVDIVVSGSDQRIFNISQNYSLQQSLGKYLEIGENIHYLLTNTSSFAHHNLKEIIENKSDEFNIASGTLKSIKYSNNTQNNITYFDNDNDGYISINDRIVINGSVSIELQEALNSSWGARLVLLYDGEDSRGEPFLMNFGAWEFRLENR